MDVQLTPKQAIYYSTIFDIDGVTVLDNEIEEFAFFGGFGSGKSYVVMLCTLIICLSYPKTEWLFCRSSYPELKDSVIPQFLSAFPEDQFNYKYKKADRDMIFQNGSKIVFRAFDKDTKILSNMYHGASLCQAENLAYDFYLALIGRIRLKGLGKNILLLEGNPASTWVRDRYKNLKDPLKKTPLAKEELKKIFLIEAITADNPHLDAKYIQKLIATYPESWVKRYVFGEWEEYDERVFSEFRANIHLLNPFEIPKEWEKFMGGDYGWRNPSAIIWGAMDYNGSIIIYDEFYAKEQLPEELARHTRRHGVIPLAFDFSAKRPDRDGKSVWSDLESLGVPLIESNKDELRNILSANTLFKANKLFITKNCVNFIRELEGLKWQPKKLGDETNFKEQVVDKNNHSTDAFLYLLAYIEDMKSEDPSIPDPTQTMQYYTQTMHSFREGELIEI